MPDHLASTPERGIADMVPIPISITTALQYPWGDNCEGWHLVRSAALSVIEERMPPGAKEVRHWHTRALQFFYVLSGTIVMEVEGERHELTAGLGIQIPSGTAHQARNQGSEDARFLVISSPPHQGDRRDTDAGEF
jgi:mannose-6-phosphate isomerase-like protein (cupin superfamily)